MPGRERESDPDERALSWANIHPNTRPEPCDSLQGNVHLFPLLLSSPLSLQNVRMQMNVKSERLMVRECEKRIEDKRCETEKAREGERGISDAITQFE